MVGPYMRKMNQAVVCMADWNYGGATKVSQRSRQEVINTGNQSVMKR